MNKRNDWSWAIAAAVICTSGFSLVSAPVFATENAQERRGARDTKQDARQTGRSEKIDCRKANNKSNSAWNSTAIYTPTLKSRMHYLCQ